MPDPEKIKVTMQIELDVTLPGGVHRNRTDNITEECRQEAVVVAVGMLMEETAFLGVNILRADAEY